MSALLRTLARLVTVALLVALSLCGLAIAIFSIGSTASGDFSLPGLARLVHLPALRADIGELYARLEASGSVAWISALCGLGALVIGLLLLLGVFVGRRERLAVLESNAEGTIAARPRVLGRVVAALAEQARGVTATKVKVAVGRRGTARVGIQAAHARADTSQEVRTRTAQAVAPLSEAFGIRTNVRPKLAEGEPRVQ
jgi:hypothetical protein